ncbi:energy transducer TonB [Aliidiomarina soli]|uniref:TonB C-terminal domain-containing protein n=1 Tax=Aliidiomarina soli TaxID=1928574 RepID=A0A432WLZ1_9GAMM|nr:energy transducer TonB [Aliidiomarina soli]RUO34795.1 hypothetical protein CWE14_02010 [Aliidiomarina soli]
MNKLPKCIYLTASVVFIAACTSQPSDQSVDYEVLDVTDAEESQYWIVAKRVAPVYPMDAVRRGRAGCVEMSFVITPQGRADQIEVIRSFPDRVFNKSGPNALEQWQWAPAASNQANQAVRTTLKFDYTLEGVRNKEAAEAACQDE